MAPKREHPRDILGRFMSNLKPAELAHFTRMASQAPSSRYARSPQWQAYARRVFANPLMAEMRKLTPSDSAVGVLYGLLRDLANPSMQRFYAEAMGLPRDASRHDVYAAVLGAVPELQALGSTPQAFDRSLSDVATMEGKEKIGLKRFARDIQVARGDGKDWGAPERLRSEADKKRLADAEQRRAMIGQLAQESKRITPPHLRPLPMRDAVRPHNSRLAELHAQYAAHSGKPEAFDSTSPGWKQWNKEHVDDGPAIAARNDEVRASVQAAEQGEAAYESSLMDTAADAEATVEEWERRNNGQG